MDTKELINLMQLQNGASLFKAVYTDANGVKGSKGYTFKNVLGIPLEVGDRVVVESRDDMALVSVTSVNVRLSDVGCSLGLVKHLICKVSKTALDEAKAREADAEDKLAAAEVYERLEKYQKQLGARFENVERALLGDAGDFVEVGETIKARKPMMTGELKSHWADAARDDAENERRKMAARAEGLGTYTNTDGELVSTYK